METCLFYSIMIFVTFKPNVILLVVELVTDLLPLHLDENRKHHMPYSNCFTSELSGGGGVSGL